MSYTFKREYVNYGKNGNGYYAMQPDGITFHNTANNATAQNERDYCNNQCNAGNAAATYHYAIDDTTVIQLLPQSVNGWHSGDGTNGYGNRKTLGIEVCYTNPSLSGYSDTKYNKAMDNAFTEMANICLAYGWSVDKIGMHYDRSGKYCPRNTLDKNGGNADKTRTYIRNEVQKKINAITKPVEPTATFVERPILVDISVGNNEPDNINNIALVINCSTKNSKGSDVYFRNVDNGKLYSTNFKDRVVKYNVSGKQIDCIYKAGELPVGKYIIGVMLSDDGNIVNDITYKGTKYDKLQLIETNKKIDVTFEDIATNNYRVYVTVN